jgi:hypothetical protein
MVAGAWRLDSYWWRYGSLAVWGRRHIKNNALDRGCPKKLTKSNKLTANATAVNPRQQQVKDGGGRVDIGQLLMEIRGIN